jgi:hypothetical protein
MPDPSEVPDNIGEFIELTNAGVHARQPARLALHQRRSQPHDQPPTSGSHLALISF